MAKPYTIIITNAFLEHSTQSTCTIKSNASLTSQFPLQNNQTKFISLILQRREIH